MGESKEAILESKRLEIRYSTHLYMSSEINHTAKDKKGRLHVQKWLETIRSSVMR